MPVPLPSMQVVALELSLSNAQNLKIKRISKTRKNNKDAPPMAKWKMFLVVGGREGDPAWMVHYDQEVCTKFVAKQARTTLHLVQ